MPGRARKGWAQRSQAPLPMSMWAHCSELERCFMAAMPDMSRACSLDSSQALLSTCVLAFQDIPPPGVKRLGCRQTAPTCCYISDTVENVFRLLCGRDLPLRAHLKMLSHKGSSSYFVRASAHQTQSVTSHIRTCDVRVAALLSPSQGSVAAKHLAGLELSQDAAVCIVGRSLPE
jgi:hypothetical protein